MTVFILFDSRVATHNESIEKVHSEALVPWLVQNRSNQNLEVVKVDVSQENLPSSFPINAAKVASKTNASFVIRADDSLHKI